MPDQMSTLPGLDSPSVNTQQQNQAVQQMIAALAQQNNPQSQQNQALGQQLNPQSQQTYSPFGVLGQLAQAGVKGYMDPNNPNSPNAANMAGPEDPFANLDQYNTPIAASLAGS